MVACTPKLTTRIEQSYPTLHYMEDVLVLNKTDDVPREAEFLGSVITEVEDHTRFCSLESILYLIEMEARKVGGNVIQIKKHKTPFQHESNCHAITADILKVDDTEALKESLFANDELRNADFALYHLYHEANPEDLLFDYDVYLGDSVLFDFKKDWKKTIKITEEGNHAFFVQGLSESFELKTEFGNEYYIRFGFGGRGNYGLHTIEIVDTEIGRIEYNLNRFHQSTKPDKIFLNDGRELEGIITRETDDRIHFKMILNDREIETNVDKSKVQKVERANQ